MSVAPLNLTSRVAADKLTLLAAVALVIGLVAARLRTSRLLSWPLALVALLATWQLAGWPRAQPELLSVWPAALIVGGAILIAGALAGGQAAEPLRPAMGGVVLAAALHIAAAPWTMVLLALVPSAAALPMLAAPRMTSLVLLAPLCGVAATAALADVTLGRLSRGGFRLMDAAALSPFAALLLMQFMQARMPPPIAAALAGGIAVGAVWIVGTLRWLP